MDETGRGFKTRLNEHKKKTEKKVENVKEIFTRQTRKNNRKMISQTLLSQTTLSIMTTSLIGKM